MVRLYVLIRFDLMCVGVCLAGFGLVCSVVFCVLFDVLVLFVWFGLVSSVLCCLFCLLLGVGVFGLLS